jgi:methyl-accepting chemotaxis protein
MSLTVAVIIVVVAMIFVGAALQRSISNHAKVLEKQLETLKLDLNSRLDLLGPSVGSVANSTEKFLEEIKAVRREMGGKRGDA